MPYILMTIRAYKCEDCGKYSRGKTMQQSFAKRNSQLAG